MTRKSSELGVRVCASIILVGSTWSLFLATDIAFTPFDYIVLITVLLAVWIFQPCLSALFIMCSAIIIVVYGWESESFFERLYTRLRKRVTA